MTSPRAAARVRTASSQIERRRLQVKVSLSPAPLRGDPDLIERLAANILDRWRPKAR